MSAVSALDLVFGYELHRRIFDGASFEIHPGATVALMGPSGSGKSTLLALIGGLIRPDSGTVVPGTNHLGEIGWIFQTVNVLGRRSVLDNASIGAFQQADTIKQARTLAYPYLESVGIGHLAMQRASTLSGGELQRVVIARALVSNPALVLADEPTGQLDQETTEHVIDALVRSRPPGTTVIIATHDPTVARFCESTLMVKNGLVSFETV